MQFIKNWGQFTKKRWGQRLKLPGTFLSLCFALHSGFHVAECFNCGVRCAVNFVEFTEEGICVVLDCSGKSTRGEKTGEKDERVGGLGDVGVEGEVGEVGLG